jgi:hypothetical protein
VQADGLGDAPSITAALDSITPGDTILVHSGDYFEHIEVEVPAPGVLIRSVAGRDSTTIDGQGTGRCLRVEWPSDTTTIIEGLTLTNGVADAGGGAFLRSGILRDCTIVGNQAEAGGGVLLYAEAVGARLERCVITENTATGGLFGETGGGIFSNVPLSIIDVAARVGGSLATACDIYGNTPDNFCRRCPIALDLPPCPSQPSHIDISHNYWGSVSCGDLGITGVCSSFSPWTDATHSQVVTDGDCGVCPEPLAVGDESGEETTWGQVRTQFRERK